MCRRSHGFHTFDLECFFLYVLLTTPFKGGRLQRGSPRHEPGFVSTARASSLRWAASAGWPRPATGEFWEVKQDGILARGGLVVSCSERVDVLFLAFVGTTFRVPKILCLVGRSNGLILTRRA